jgi:hypothetical protein
MNMSCIYIRTLYTFLEEVFQEGINEGMHIPLVDLRIQYQTIKHEVEAAFARVLESMQLFLGPELQAI